MNKKDAEKVANLLNTLPDKIKIGAEDFTIKIFDGMATHESLPDQSLWGYCNLDTLEIGLGSESPNGIHLAGITVHEFLHAILGVMYPRLKKNEEERIVRRTEEGLIALFRDNPWFLPWLVKGLK